MQEVNKDSDDMTTDHNICGHKYRQLTDEEMAKLTNDLAINEFRQNKLEKESKKNWDLFYKRNTNKFFKDRHWTQREFSELIGDHMSEDRDVFMLEVGCGVGNTIWPLIEDKTRLNLYVCDFSPVAIDLLQKSPLFDSNKCKPFVADITDESGFRHHLPPNVSFDLVSLIFVLSSINPTKMRTALRNIYQVMRPNGVLLFRDYGLYDHAMLRFGSGHKLSDNFYVRQDGTRAYYFSIEYMETLVKSCGFEVIQNDYIKRETINRKLNTCVDRIFIQGKYAKPDNS
ncbi:tRNA N(3)-methylcytidine methyltransferase METTL6-like [Oppia nitens]|uniref:tRNA N(3)-methylcytidine methyltransferase METTL6-like n=1 Tax=Oppia nitens TaxID=1686743 RepID=UPI0023D9B3E3|nr:tRNA N(3)-methylcytidine methyltransferase METTL6-like [Oppia nitens]